MCLAVQLQSLHACSHFEQVCSSTDVLLCPLLIDPQLRAFGAGTAWGKREA